jgi:hypothetical protein
MVIVKFVVHVFVNSSDSLYLSTAKLTLEKICLNLNLVFPLFPALYQKTEVYFSLVSSSGIAFTLSTTSIYTATQRFFHLCGNGCGLIESGDQRIRLE